MIDLIPVPGLRLTFVICLPIFLISCEHDLPLEPVREIPTTVQPFVDQFVFEAVKRGITLDVSKLNFEFVSGIEGGNGQQTVVGSCTRLENKDLIRIDTLNSLWLLSGQLGKEEVVFHELGHCLLNRTHRDDKFLSNDFSSIMRTVGLLQYGDLNNFTSLFLGPTGIYAHKRDYYIEELFDENTPAPCWSDPNIGAPYPIKLFDDQFIKERSYREMWIDPEGSLWFYGGPKNYKLVDEVFEQQLQHVEIKAMENDNKGNLWIAGLFENKLFVGTYKSGVLQTKFTADDISETIISVDNMLLDGQDRLWISDTEGNLLVQGTDGIFEMINVIPERRVTKMRRGADSTVYIIKGGMLLKFNGPDEQIHLNSENSDLPTDSFRDLEVDNNGVVWLEYSGPASYLIQLTPNLDVKTFDFYDINMAELRLNSMASDSNGNLWAATSNGIKKWEGDSFSRYCSFNTGVPVLSFRRIIASKNGIVWSIGNHLESSSPVLMRFDPGS